MDQIAHLIKQLGGQQDRDQRHFVFAHIANYDPTTHSVRCIIPSWRDEDSGTPVVTPWIPLGTPSAGGMLVQFAPKTGATVQNPTAGELVVIQLFDRARGTAAVASQLFTNAIQPPSGLLDNPLKGGEGVIYHADSGTYIRFLQRGDLEIKTTGRTTVSAQQDVVVTTQANATVSATGSSSVVSVTATSIQLAGTAGDTLHSLVMDTFQATYNGHTHGNGPVPDQLMTNEQLTAIVKAE